MQCLLDQHLGHRIHAGRRLVQDQDAGIGQHRAGDADELALADRKVGASLQDLGLVAIRQGGDELVGLGQADGFLCLLIPSRNK
jgi:hypothetical protein